MLKHNASYSCESENKEVHPTPIEKKFSSMKESLCEMSLLKRIDGKTHTTWQEYTVKNVSQYSIIDDNLSPTIIKCPEFSSGAGIENDNWSWNVAFYHQLYLPWIFIYAKCDCSKNDVDVRAVIAAYLVDNEGNEIFGGHCPGYYSGLHDCKIANFLDRQSDFDKEKFLPNDSLTVRLKLTILLDDKTPFPAIMPIKLEPKASLPSHFEELYRSRENTADVLIKVQDRTFQAHKEVLKIRYPRLLDMFAIQVFQGKKYFEIAGIDCNVFEKILEFLYLDEVADINDCIVPLWKAAHKYQLKSLKSICEKTISEDYLSLENVDVINNLANKFGSVGLRIYIIMFINANK